MSTGVDYHHYLASREWSLKREAIRRRSGNHCERCFIGKQEAVHHLTYERLGNEDLEDLLAICNACHEYLSGVNDYDPRKRMIALIDERLDITDVVGGFVRLRKEENETGSYYRGECKQCHKRDGLEIQNIIQNRYHIPSINAAICWECREAWTPWQYILAFSTDDYDTAVWRWATVTGLRH